jgi:hypothetical protein
MDDLNDFFDLFSEHFHEINASMWASLRARLVLPNRIRTQFPPSLKKGGLFDLPDAIIAHLTRKCGGNMHDRRVVDIMQGHSNKRLKRLIPTRGI